jgi:hypothetical protein
VADNDQCAVESLQRILQFLDRGQIEMVGRLVQQQEERRLRTGEAAGGPAPRSAAKLRPPLALTPQVANPPPRSN